MKPDSPPASAQVLAIQGAAPSWDFAEERWRDAEVVTNNFGSMSVVGNGRRVALRHNDGSLSVVGNDIRVVVQNNNGVVKATGNGCDVLVMENNGQVCMIGNNGNVLVAARNQGAVKYTGNGGCVRVRGGRAEYNGCGGHVDRNTSANAVRMPCACRGAAGATTMMATPRDADTSSEVVFRDRNTNVVIGSVNSGLAVFSNDREISISGQFGVNCSINVNVSSSCIISNTSNSNGSPCNFSLPKREDHQ